MQTHPFISVTKTAFSNPDGFQLMMLALALVNVVVLMMVLLSEVPGIQVLWFIPALGILMCLLSVVLSPFTKSL